MRCDQFSANVEALLSEELDQQTARDVREHADSCEECERLLRSSAAVADSLRALEMHSMPSSVESHIRGALLGTHRPARRTLSHISRRAMAFAGALAMVVVVLGLFLMRQGPVTAAQVVARAVSKLEGISSYHVKYKSTIVQRDGRHDVSYHEVWYKAPDSMRSVLTQRGSVWGDLLKGNTRRWYIEGSDVAFVMPVRSKERMSLTEGFFVGKTPVDMLSEFGEGYTYAGTERLGKWQCDVIEGTFEGGETSVRACIDRKTGVLVKYARGEKGGSGYTEDLQTLDINEPIADDVFSMPVPEDVLLIRAPAMDSFLLNVNLYQTETDGSSRPMDPDEITRALSRIAEQGASHNAPLRDLYEPSYIPNGYVLLGASHFGERHKRPAGEVIDLTTRFKTVYMSYLSPRTGDTLSLVESSEAIKGSEEGREMSIAGFQARVQSYSTPFPYVELFWEQGGVHFRLSASSLGEKEAIKIARSMRLLGTAPSVDSGAASQLPLPLETGMWRITFLAQGTIREKLMEQTAEQVRKRLIKHGFTRARVRIVPTGRIEVTAHGVGEQIRQAVILPDDLPARLRDYEMHKLW